MGNSDRRPAKGRVGAALGSGPLRALFSLCIQAALCFLAGCNAPTATRTGTGHLGGAALTAVYSRARGDYARVTNPDGTYRAETYILRSGGNFGGPRVDPTMDNLTFEDVTRVIAGPLAAQNYLPSDDPAKTRLLIVVFWGVTITPGDVMPLGTRPSDMLAQKANSMAITATASGPGRMGGSSSPAADFAARQDILSDADTFAGAEIRTDAHIDALSANILGYTDEIRRTKQGDPYLLTLKDEVENDRYYVVLLAYDYRFARKFGLHKLLWETRYSIPELGNDFERAFPLMTSIAAKYFGQDSDGLIHHSLGEGRVEVGEPKSLGPVPEK